MADLFKKHRGRFHLVSRLYLFLVSYRSHSHPLVSSAYSFDRPYIEKDGEIIFFEKHRGLD
uniref:Uncharacterized protein n=1 Tax=Picea glauca TaxID=3330 RepID=A0A101LW71_PICGL|nr:hypothetical protein ABT39_MTgene1565 [Picea glauca]QHR88350.1 hypothetical protein Q903MT_gene2363 [Picea sitchensis]